LTQTFVESCVDLEVYPYSWFRGCHTGDSYTLTTEQDQITCKRNMTSPGYRTHTPLGCLHIYTGLQLCSTARLQS